MMLSRPASRCLTRLSTFRSSSSSTSSAIRSSVSSQREGITTTEAAEGMATRNNNMKPSLTTMSRALFSTAVDHQPRSHHHFPNHSAVFQEDDLDDLCRQHMDLPAQEFAIGCSFLHQVALGNKKELESLLDDRPSLVNFRDYDRRTALHIAASEGHLELCQLLVSKGALINRSDRWGGSPLDDAHRCRHTQILKYLKDQGGKFGSPSQATCFITAASEGDVEEVRTLMEFGQNIEINQGDCDRRTALHLAAGEGRTAVVQILCEAGADVNAQDRWGNRPWDDAMSGGHRDCVELLKQYGGIGGPSSSLSLSSGADVEQAMGQETALLDLMHHYGKVRNGVLSMDWHDVKNLMDGIGEESSDEVVQKLFEAADIDGNGLIDTSEFLAHSDTFLGGRPARIILVVGGPGSGKGVLCQRLVEECGVVHLSAEELLSDEIQNGTCLGNQVKDILNDGGLVSSAIMVTLMKKRMRDHPGKRILLHGFPKSRENAQDLVTLCGKPELALHLTCDDTVLLERIMKRNRPDDTLDNALKRIRSFHKVHDMTLDFLREEHVPIVYLDGSAKPNVIWDQLRAVGRLMRNAVQVFNPKKSVSLATPTAKTIKVHYPEEQENAA